MADNVELTIGVVVFAVQALGWLWLVFGRLKQVELNSTRIDATEQKLDRILEELDKLAAGQQALAVALFGYDGRNGMRSELKELKADIRDLWHSPTRSPDENDA